MSTSPGSSPLSRGIRRGTPRGRTRRGIIPALAGNTTAGSTPTLWHWDHPRSRGEYRVGELCAGYGGDHPRSRGEYFGGGATHPTTWGSSPLSRGIRWGHPWGLLSLGIIPALAGNTDRRRPTGPGWTDHPRSRGEYLLRGFQAVAGGGSSPLSRGIRGGRC